MAKKTSKAKRPPSPYNVCMSNALKGKKGSKEEVRANFKEASAACKTQSKKPTYSVNPRLDYKCAYCGKTHLKSAFEKIDEIAAGLAEADPEHLEGIYDYLPKAVGRSPPYIHDSNKGPVLNICNSCFDAAREKFESEPGDLYDEEDDADDGLGLERSCPNCESTNIYQKDGEWFCKDCDSVWNNDEDTDDFRNITYDAETDTQTIDYDIEELPDALILYDIKKKLLIVESRSSGDYEFENIENPMEFLRQRFPQK
jgi:hypothetical protein